MSEVSFLVLVALIYNLNKESTHMNFATKSEAQHRGNNGHIVKLDAIEVD